MLSLIPVQIPKNLVRIKDPNIMATVLREASRLPSNACPKKPECSMPGFEYDWDRVLKMRAEKHPLMQGGKQS